MKSEPAASEPEDANPGPVTTTEDPIDRQPRVWARETLALMIGVLALVRSARVCASGLPGATQDDDVQTQHVVIAPA